MFCRAMACGKTEGGTEDVVHKKCGKEVTEREWSDFHYGEWIFGISYHCFECDDHYLENDDMEATP